MIDPASVRAFGAVDASGSVPPNDAVAVLGVASGAAPRSRTRSGWYGSHRCDDLLGRLELRPAGRLLGDRHDAVARLTDEVPELVRRRRTELDEAPRVADQRVARLDLLDLRDRPIRRLGVAARRGPTAAPSAGGGRRLARACARADRPPRPPSTLVELAVGRDVAEVRHAFERRLDPALGVGTLMPVPLSSHTSRSGIGRPMRTA